MPENNTQAHNMTDRVLGAIEASGVAPKPHWHFLVREWVVWLVAIGAFVVGSVATALTLYIGEVSFFMEQHIVREHASLAHVFTVLPYVWIVLVVAGVFYSVHALHATKRGYRWHTSWLVGGALLASVVVGWSVHAAGLSESFDRYLLAEVPAYRPLSGFDPMHWMDPGQGFLAGVVTEVQSDGFVVRGLDNVVTEVSTTASTSIPQHFELREGTPVRVIGTTTEEAEVFEAVDVRPFRGRGPGRRAQDSNASYGSGQGPGMGARQNSKN